MLTLRTEKPVHLTSFMLFMAHFPFFGKKNIKYATEM